MFYCRRLPKCCKNYFAKGLTQCTHTHTHVHCERAERSATRCTYTLYSVCLSYATANIHSMVLGSRHVTSVRCGRLKGAHELQHDGNETFLPENATHYACCATSNQACCSQRTHACMTMHTSCLAQPMRPIHLHQQLRPRYQMLLPPVPPQCIRAPGKGPGTQRSPLQSHRRASA